MLTPEFAWPSGLERLSAQRFAAALRPGLRLYWPGCAGHSAVFEQWWLQACVQTAGVHVSGVWIPGINRFDPTTTHPEVRACGLFAAPEFAAARQRGAFDWQATHYTDAAREFTTPGRFDVLLLHLSPPDAQGRCSFSVAADFSPLAVQAALSAGGTGTQIWAHLNPNLPRTAGPWVALSSLHAAVFKDAEVLTVAEPAPGAALKAVAEVVAASVADGSSLQLGLGKLQTAVLAALHGRRGLRIHSGMLSDGLLPLLNAGALAALDADQPPVCAGVALGSAALYRALADPRLARFAPVSHTHATATLAALPRFVAVNSALQVDLLGQVNAEFLDGQPISGLGGLADFMRGARANPEGRAIVAFPATAAGVSRIVPRLAAGTVSICKADADEVATEHGLVRLRGLPLAARARALIGIAAPQHRAALQQQAASLGFFF
jgi:acyl-CoA hydrolase